MRNRPMHRLISWAAWLLSIASLFVALHASAAVTKEGTWPASDAKVTLDLDGVPRAQALRKLADAAGWSLVVQTSLGADAGDLIDVHVKNQPADKVLDLVLEDGWIAKRDGTLVSLTRGPGGAPPAAPVTAAPPAAPAPPPVPAPPSAATDTPAAPEPPEPAGADAAPGATPSISVPSPVRGKHGKKGEDRVLTGGNITIGKDETVHDVVLFGGNADVYGIVTGDVSVTGGNATIHPGAHVKGDVVGVGGNVNLEDGA
jgi:hypothetical protein